MDEVLLRPLRPDDVPVVERISAEAFLEVDRARVLPGDPAPEIRSPAGAENWVRRTRRFVETDPGGCWAAEQGGDVVGFATSVRRESLWVLATYAVRPGLQGRGTGRRLLDAALGHGDGCTRYMLPASDDPAAVRRYLLAGFALHPQMYLHGRLDRAAVPPGTGARVREGSADDVALLDRLDRGARGAGHGPDHVLMREAWRLLVVDDAEGSGYAYAGDGRLALLAASDEATATDLLWTVLADGPDEPLVPHLTGANSWALRVGAAARLQVRTEGFLALRGMDPPSPYVHNGAML
jgi:GNAT superfamily N-acetyltransferase